MTGLQWEAEWSGKLIWGGSWQPWIKLASVLPEYCLSSLSSLWSVGHHYHRDHSGGLVITLFTDHSGVLLITLITLECWSSLSSLITLKCCSLLWSLWSIFHHTHWEYSVVLVITLITGIALIIVITLNIVITLIIVITLECWLSLWLLHL